jgi:lipoprotein NlpI
VKEFNYLGILLTTTGNFKRAIKTLPDKGTKAMYEYLIVFLKVFRGFCH